MSIRERLSTWWWSLPGELEEGPAQGIDEENGNRVTAVNRTVNTRLSLSFSRRNNDLLGTTVRTLCSSPATDLRPQLPDEAMLRELFALHLPNPDRVRVDYAVLAEQSRGVGSGDILNNRLNAIYAGSTNPNPNRRAPAQDRRGQEGAPERREGGPAAARDRGTGQGNPA